MCMRDSWCAHANAMYAGLLCEKQTGWAYKAVWSNVWAVGEHEGV